MKKAAIAALAAALVIPVPASASRRAAPQLDVFDMFHRNVEDHGVQLVDWEG